MPPTEKEECENGDDEEDERDTPMPMLTFAPVLKASGGERGGLVCAGREEDDPDEAVAVAVKGTLIHLAREDVYAGGKLERSADCQRTHRGCTTADTDVKVVVMFVYIAVRSVVSPPREARIILS
jgi:hypothetical protein